MTVKACNYKNFLAKPLFLSRIATIASFAKSHACKFSTLWITPVDNTSDAIRRNNTADTRHHHTTQTTPCSYTPQLHSTGVYASSPDSAPTRTALLRRRYEGKEKEHPTIGCS